MSSDATKRMRELMRKLRRQGFIVTVANSGHFRVEAPDGSACQVSQTPGSSSGVRTQIARLKRIGYQP